MSNKKYASVSELKTRIYDIFNLAIHFSDTSNTLIQRLNSQLYETADYKRLTRVDQAYLRGIAVASFDNLFRDHLIFAHVVNGVYVPVNSGVEFDYAAISANNASADESYHSRHVWKHSNKPF